MLSDSFEGFFFFFKGKATMKSGRKWDRNSISGLRLDRMRDEFTACVCQGVSAFILVWSSVSS